MFTHHEVILQISSFLRGNIFYFPPTFFLLLSWIFVIVKYFYIAHQLCLIACDILITITTQAKKKVWTIPFFMTSGLFRTPHLMVVLGCAKFCFNLTSRWYVLHLTSPNGLVISKFSFLFLEIQRTAFAQVLSYLLCRCFLLNYCAFRVSVWGRAFYLGGDQDVYTYAPSRR